MSVWPLAGLGKGSARQAAIAVAALIATVFVAFSLHLPLSLLSVAGIDDALFWRLGETIAQGRWLGRFDELTLAKGPGFPIVLAVNAWLGTPLTLTMALIQLASASVLAWELRRWGMSRPWVLLVWALVLFQPACLPIRAIRDHLYQALTLVVAASWLHLLRVPAAAGWAAGGLGATLGLFWATREEGVWVAPAYALLALHAVWAARADSAPRRRVRLLRWCRFALGAAVVLGAICSANGLKYGFWGVVDFKSAAFVGLMSRLNSIEVADRKDYVPVTREQRALAYAVSPALRELRARLEQPDHPLLQDGCRLYETTCGDFAGGWFMWALREAVASAGHYRHARDANEFYRRALAEMESACNQGRLRCLSPGWSFLPRMTDAQWSRWGPAVGRALAVSGYREGVPLTAGPSGGPHHRVAAFAEFLGHPRHVPTAGLAPWRVGGWFVSDNGDWLELRCGLSGSEVVEQIPRLPTPDLPLALRRAGVENSRFFVERSQAEACRLVRRGRPEQAIAWSVLTPGWSATLDGATTVIWIDVVEKDGIAEPRALRWKAWLAQRYRQLMGVLMPLAALVLPALWVMQRRGRRWSLWTGVAGLCALSAALRVALLALVDATSFPGVNVVYLGPSTQLWTLAALLAFHALWRHIHEADHLDALPQ